MKQIEFDFTKNVNSINNLHKKSTVATYEEERNIQETNLLKPQLIGIQPNGFYNTLCEKKETSDAVINNIQDGTLRGKISQDIIKNAYFKDGIKASLFDQNIDLQRLRLQLEMNFNLGRNSAVWADFANGLYKGLSTGFSFEGIDYLYTSNGYPNVAKVLLTLSQLKKCTFGGLVNIDGNFLYGTRDILKHYSYKDLVTIIAGALSGKGGEPILSSYNKRTNYLYTDKPIIVKSFNNGLFEIWVDLKYCPMRIDKKTGKLIADDRYILQPTGLYSLCLIGANLLRKQCNAEKIPTATKIYQLLQAVVASDQQQSFLHIKSITRQGRENIRLERDAITNMCNTYRMVNGKKYINYKETIDFINQSAKAYMLALQKTGIYQRLYDDESNADPLIIDTEHSAEFPQENPKSIYIKINHIKNITL